MTNPFRAAGLASLEFKNMGSRDFLKLAFCAVALIPLIFACMYVWAYMDPIENLDQLPVAVVNLDEGAQMDGEHINVGDALVERLESNDGMNWRFVDAASAREGLVDGTYYFVLTVPADFSRSIASVAGDEPQQAQLNLEYNQAINALASQVSKTVIKQLQYALLTSVNSQYYESIFLKIEEAVSGMQEASEGAGTLSTALTGLQIGSNILSTTLTASSSGGSALIEGFELLSSGAHGLADGLGQVDEGIQSLAQAVDKLCVALSTLDKDVRGLSDLIAGNLERMEYDVKSIDSILLNIESVIGDDQHYPDSDSKLLAIELILGGSEGEKSLREIVEDLDEQLQLTDEAGDKVKEDIQALAALIDELKGLIPQGEGEAGFANLSEALDALNSYVQAFAQGMGALHQGAQALAEGLDAAASGAGQLMQAMELLSKGSTGLSENIGKVQAGAAELADALNDGVDEASLLLEGEDARIKVLSEPVNLNSGYFTKLKNYGSGFAPFFLSIALWLGALLAGFIFKPLNGRIVASSASPVAAALAGYLPIAGMSALQGVLAGVALQLLLGVQVDCILGFYLMIIAEALAFSAILQFLVAGFDFPGRFVSILLLILQITSSGGTFPVQTSPAFFQSISPFMPMSHGIAGMRLCCAGANPENAWVYGAVLLGFALLFLLGTCVLAALKRSVKLKDIQPLFSL